MSQPSVSATLGGQFKRHLPAYVLGTFMLAVFQLAMNRIDWMSKLAIDRIFGNAPGAAWQPAVIMLALALMAFLTRVASRWFMFNAGRDVEYDLRKLLLDKLHTLGAAFYRVMGAGEIMSRATNDLQQVRLLFGFGVLNIVNVVFAFASAFQIMLGISLKLTLACMLNMPILVFVTRSLSRGLFIHTKANQEAIGELSTVVQRNLAGVRVVRSFALEEREWARFEEVNQRYLRASLGLARLRGSLGPMVGAVAALGVIVFFWYGASLLLRSPAEGGLTQGSFFAFWMAFGRMTWPMLALGFSISIVQRGRAGYVRLKELFDTQPEVVDGPLVPTHPLAGSVRVNGLSFKYGEHKVLDDVSLDLRQGESLAIVGRTGSGKSTLAMLLARLLPTPAKTVFIDGNDVCDLPLSAVRATIGYAQQDAFLFSTTVARNIGFALEDPDSPAAAAKVREAAREAQMYDEAMALPEQLDTVVGERGVQLSGGQKQRVALARALVSADPPEAGRQSAGEWEPKILVLDDPLSAVDAKTESAILDAVERQAACRTVVLITHRVAAAARCDSIVVLERGRVVERGTHAELVRAGGVYAAFAEEQKMAGELEEIDADEDAAVGSA